MEAVGTNSLNNQRQTYELRAIVRFSNRGGRGLFITFLNSQIPMGLKPLLLYQLGGFENSAIVAVKSDILTFIYVKSVRVTLASIR